MSFKKIKCSECQCNCFMKLCKTKNIQKMPVGQYFVRKGEYIFKEGDYVTEMYFVQRGKVKIISTGLDGKKHIVRLATDGHILGHRGYGNEIYPVSAIALEDSKICSVDNTTLYELMKINFDFSYQLMMFYSSELRKSELRVKCFAQMTVKEKVIYAIIYIIDTFGLDSNNALNGPITRQEIASIAGTNDEQVSRALLELKKRGLISTNKRKIIINDYETLKSCLNHYGIILHP